MLLELGCKSFVCVGKYSESLHDFIDEVIVELTLDNNDNNDVFLTTWHDDQSNDEVIDFFLHTPNWSDGLKLAMFDNDNPADQGLKKVLIHFAEKSEM